MTQSVNISSSKKVLAYDQLREEGISNLNNIQWTDHNTSDPGITILEQLCYALSDLSYRANFDIPDLLSEKGKDAYASLYSPRTILGSRPVTLTDLKAVLIDHPNIKNVWIQQKDDFIFAKAQSDDEERWDLWQADQEIGEAMKIKGAYRILVELKTPYQSEAEKNKLRTQVFKQIQANRNLGEDVHYQDIFVLPPQEIQVNAKVEIQAGASPELILANILYRVQQYIAPDLPFYTLQEMLLKGKRMEDIFDGPLLRHGFVDMQALKTFDKKTSLQSSDLIQEIMDVPGVKAVTKIQMQTEEGGETSTAWELVLDPEKAPILKLPHDLANAKEPISIKLNMNGLPVGIDRKLLAKLFTEVKGPANIVPQPAELDIIPPQGNDRDIAHYYSIQHHFPDTYGINVAGLPESETPERKAQARNLKAYLMFFDQILANTFAQLEHAKKLLAYQEGPTYVTLPLLHPEDDQDLLQLQSLLLKQPAEHLQELQALIENDTQRLQRRNQFLDHLLARFSEELQAYSFLMYELMEEDWTEAGEKLVSDKVRLLQDYPLISANRSGGFDKSRPANDKENIALFKKRICLLLGIEQVERESISPVYYRQYYDFDDNNDPTLHWEIVDIDSGVILLNDFMLDQERSDSDLSPKGRGGINPILGKGGFGVITPPAGFNPFVYLPGLTFPGAVLSPDLFLREQKIQELLASLEELKSTQENFHLIEHTLLRPIPEEQSFIIKRGSNSEEVRVFSNELPAINSAYTKDPFSLQMTFVLPLWAGRMQREDFRRLLEQTLDSERPAHQVFRMQWLDAARMGNFEIRYKEWLQQLEKYINREENAHYELRTARNRLIDILDIGWCYPLPDLPVRPQSNTYYQEEQPVLEIDFTEKDVWYLLYYKDNEDDEEWIITDVRKKSDGGQITIEAPPLYQDAQVFYRIEARKWLNGKELSRWLLDEEIVYVGLNENLDVHFDNGLQTIEIAYNTGTTVIISDSQDSISYQIFADEGGERPLSPTTLPGNGGMLSIYIDPDPDPDINFKEDLEKPFIRAFKDLDQDGVPDDPEHVRDISTELKIFVRPDPAVLFEPEMHIVDYDTHASIIVPTPQITASYWVGALELPFDAFSFQEPSEGNFLMPLNEQEVPVYMLSDFEYEGSFQEGDPLQTVELKEDSLVFVKAYKTNGTSQLLTHRAAILVRPNPAVDVEWPDGPVSVGEFTDIVLTNTQKGVHYQLYLESGGILVPVYREGYHYEDRAIETMRVGIDFLLDHASKEPLPLRTEVFTEAGQYVFHIFAIKTRTGVRQELNDSPGTIEVIA
jgi:hypothetical protein